MAAMIQPAGVPHTVTCWVRATITPMPFASSMATATLRLPLELAGTAASMPLTAQVKKPNPNKAAPYSLANETLYQYICEVPSAFNISKTPTTSGADSENAMPKATKTSALMNNHRLSDTKISLLREKPIKLS